MKNLFTTCFILLFSSLAFGQYESVVFDYEMAYFNNGQALPAEQFMIFSGEISSEIEAVEISIFKPNGKKPLYAGLWQREKKKGTESFRLPLNFRLEGSTSYDLKIVYFKSFGESGKRALEQRLLQKLNFSLDNKLSSKEKPAGEKLLKELNLILEEGFQSLRNFEDIEASAFSSSFSQYLKATPLDSLNLLGMKELMKKEVENLLEKSWVITAKKREVQDYPTEKKANALALNVGYGGVLLSGQADNFTYGSAPYVGLSIPLSNRAHGSSILRNTSISLGAFTKNLEGPEDQVFSGPIFGRPYFAGLGYSIFRFIRFNAGAVVIEEKPEIIAGENPNFDLNRIRVQAFIGLSAEIKFQVGLNNR